MYLCQRYQFFLFLRFRYLILEFFRDSVVFIVFHLITMPFFVICDLSSEMSTRTTRRIHATSETGTWYPLGTPTSIYTSVTIGVAQSVVFCVCVVFCKQVFLFHLAILSLFFFELRLDFLVAFGIFKLVCPYILTLCQSSVGLRLRKGKTSYTFNIHAVQCILI